MNPKVQTAVERFGAIGSCIVPDYVLGHDYFKKVEEAARQARKTATLLCSVSE